MLDPIVTHDWLAARAAATPHALALIEEGRQWTYEELDSLVASTCHTLSGVGVESGTHAAVLLPNCLAFVAMIHAIARLGAVLVPLNTRLSASELAAQISSAKCTHIITSDDYATGLSGLTDGVPRIVVVSERLEALHHRISVSEVTSELTRDHLQAIVFTSGTSGQSKGAMLTYENHFYGAIALAFRLGISPDDRWLACLPLYHVGGLAIVLRACLYGTAVVLIRQVNAESILKFVRENAVTIVSLVPTMLYRLLESPDVVWLSSLRCVLLGGAAATPELLARAAAAGIPVATTYGLTEAASQVATMVPAEAKIKPGSVGRALLFTSIRIADSLGLSVETGIIGEICVQGPGVFLGYFNDEVATAAALRNGELHTGDMGFLDSGGDLWVVQRRSDLIVTGGENVYPAEVEKVLTQHPAVVAACVVGLEDPEWGQRVGALVTVRDAVSPEELLAHVRHHLAGYKVPRVIVIGDSLPLTGSGKISRPGVVATLLGSGEFVQ